MRRSVGLHGALLLLACDSGATRQDPARPKPTSIAMPAIEHVLPPGYSDGTCECRIRGVCANIADAVPGHWEGRNLRCRIEDAARATVRCSFDARYINETYPERPVAGAWQRRESVFHNYRRGDWSLGTG